jgi:acetolactate synthase I/II/III large subunit
MKLRGSDIVVRALEDSGARFTFGIPGTHNIELYDALERSDRVRPVLVTDEQSASFMADGVSRTSDSIGVVNVVPGAGVTHALSGVAEAFMDNVPMVVLACGIRSDTGKAFQLHAIDQLALLRPITKATLRPASPADMYAAVRRAFDLAREGTPGPVAVEIPAEYYLLVHDVPTPCDDLTPPPERGPADADVTAAADMLNGARQPLLYVGNGVAGVGAPLVALAEKLGAPVATTIQGKGVFPETHPLWLWNGLGASAPAFVREAMKRVDLMLAIGCRFSEVATASYGFTPSENLIHVDINGDVFNRNYRARLAVPSDAAAFVNALLPAVAAKRHPADVLLRIAAGHRDVRDEWRKHASADRVTPSVFFTALQQALPDAIYVADSGNGTFLAMEHLRLTAPRSFIAPIDYSCMGYAVPAAIGAKLANPHRHVVALAGDGALLMTGLELLTAAHLDVAPLVFVLRDGELAQIAQFQRTSLNRNTCSLLPPYQLEKFAAAVHADYLPMETDADVTPIIEHAEKLSRANRPVMIEVAIDYSRKSYFTRGVVTTNFWRLPLADRFRMLARAATRHLFGSGARTGELV